jgi:tol-pal system protein YbgF
MRLCIEWLGMIAGCVAVIGCATPADMRKLDQRVRALEHGGATKGDAAKGRVADLGAEIEALQQAVDKMNGRLDVIEKQVQTAAQDARAARSEAYGGTGGAPGAAPGAAPGGAPAPGAAPTAAPGAPANAGAGGPAPGEAASAEVQSYRDAYAKWRSGDAEGCVDLFSKFLQTYPASDYADDATYWLADCYFKQGNFSAAVLRFDDVARQYPSGDKAADALYRQGEALLRMGHGTAAGNAFEKVLRDYPTSARAPEAKRQLQLLGAG